LEAFESIALFIDTIVFLQNNISMGVHPHPVEDILFHDPTMSIFRSILQVGEQIIPLTL